MDVTVSRSYAQHVVISPDAVVRIERRSAEETRRASYIAFLSDRRRASEPHS